MTEEATKSEESPKSAYSQLSPQYKLFVDYWLIHKRGAPAARDAGYAEASANRTAYRLLRDPRIKAAIKERLDEVAMSADEALALLSEQARASIEDFITIVSVDEKTEDGAMPLYRLDLQKAQKAGKLHLIKSITETKYGTRIELHDPQTAQINILRVRGQFKDSVDVTTKGESLNNDNDINAAIAAELARLAEGRAAGDVAQVEGDADWNIPGGA